MRIFYLQLSLYQDKVARELMWRVMGILLTVIGAVMAVFIVIIIHEAGHFFVAKAFGVKVLRFSIGFGPSLWTRIGRTGTEYVLAMFPLGGYVRMLDDREMHVSQADSRRAYNRQPLWIRMAIVLAGVVTNFLLAIIIFWIIYLSGISYVKPIIGKVTPESIAARAGLQPGETIKAINGSPTQGWEEVVTEMISQIGNSKTLTITTQPKNSSELQSHSISLQNWRLNGTRPDPLGSLGIEPFQPEFPAIVEKVRSNSPASRSGLQSGDQIVGLNHQPIAGWPALSAYIHQHPNQEVSLSVKQGEVVRELNVQLDNQGQSTGYLGVEVKIPQWPPELIESPHYSVISAWVPAINRVVELTVFNAAVLGKMLSGKISLQTLGGPITIYHTAYNASKAGVQVYLAFIAFISLTLGFINILPIPGLDGGHFLFQVIEGIIGRPISEKYQMMLLKIGIILIIFLLVQGTVNDIMRMF
jgi:regulator of sigma E protease